MFLGSAILTFCGLFYIYYQYISSQMNHLVNELAYQTRLSKFIIHFTKICRSKPVNTSLYIYKYSLLPKLKSSSSIILFPDLAARAAKSAQAKSPKKAIAFVFRLYLLTFALINLIAALILVFKLEILPY